MYVSHKLTFEIVLYRVEIFMVQLCVAAGRVAMGTALQVGRGSPFFRGVGVT